MDCVLCCRLPAVLPSPLTIRRCREAPAEKLDTPPTSSTALGRLWRFFFSGSPVHLLIPSLCGSGLFVAQNNRPYCPLQPGKHFRPPEEKLRFAPPPKRETPRAALPLSYHSAAQKTRKTGPPRCGRPARCPPKLLETAALPGLLPTLPPAAGQSRAPPSSTA